MVLIRRRLWRPDGESVAFRLGTVLVLVLLVPFWMLVAVTSALLLERRNGLSHRV
jgi:uncharacterized membrane protein